MALLMLDTSACIEISRGRPILEDYSHYSQAISSITLMELWAGVHLAGGDAEIQKLSVITNHVSCLPFDEVAAKESARVLAELTKAGRKIGDLDCQIAGHVLSVGAELLTKNYRHFERVDGLTVHRWKSA